jgi:hypothetical protein
MRVLLRECFELGKRTGVRILAQVIMVDLSLTRLPKCRLAPSVGVMGVLRPDTRDFILALRIR